MDDRIAFLRDSMDFEDYFITLITRPSRYADTIVDATIVFDSYIAMTTEPEVVEALGLEHGDTISVSATIYPPGDITKPVAICPIFCSRGIADWVEERLKDGSLDEGKSSEYAFQQVRLKLLFGEMRCVEEIDAPMHMKAYLQRPIDGLEIVHIYGESYQSDQLEDNYGSFGFDDVEDDWPFSQDEDE